MTKGVICRRSPGLLLEIDLNYFNRSHAFTRAKDCFENIFNLLTLLGMVALLRLTTARIGDEVFGAEGNSASCRHVAGLLSVRSRERTVGCGSERDRILVGVQRGNARWHPMEDGDVMELPGGVHFAKRLSVGNRDRCFVRNR